MIKMKGALAFGMTLSLGFAAAPASAQDLAKGKLTFQRCGMCHTVDASGPKMGPDLGGVVGRKAGTLPGYSYSPAMKASGVSWTDSVLAGFLASPQSVVKGTKMAFPGLSSPADRANVIAYLKSIKRGK